jgi:PKHD-type hydroxylase
MDLQKLFAPPYWDTNFGAVSNEAIEKILTIAEKFPMMEALTGHGYLDRENRSCEATYIDLLNESWLKDMLWHYVSISNLNNFNFDLTTLEPPQLSVYRAETNGHFSWHKDFFWDDVHRKNELYHRKLSISIQLSDANDYEGGDFEIDLGYDNRENHIDRYPGMKEQLRQKGTIIIFPSFIRHRVTPVTKGVRKSLVVWVDGPRFR